MKAYLICPSSVSWIYHTTTYQAEFPRAPLSYTGNPELCGPPVTKNCTDKEELTESASVGHGDGNFFGTSEFYIGMGVGFAMFGGFRLSCH